jgi:hypothetical protein
LGGEAATPHAQFDPNNAPLDRVSLVAVPGGHFLFGGRSVGASEVADLDATAWVRHTTIPIDAERFGPVMVATAVGLIVWGGSGERDGDFVPLADGAIYRTSWETEP